MSMLLSLSLSAGGDILPIDTLSKFEKMDNDLVDNYLEDKDMENNFKPLVVDNCVTTCGEPAEILVYHGEDLPLAITEPCLATDSVESVS